MSSAAKCDKCGNLFERSKGCLTLDVAVCSRPTPDGGVFSNWHDVDLCQRCSKPILEALAPAMDGVRKLMSFGKQGTRRRG